MRIALSTIGTAGDVVPFVRVARRLAGRGHEVTVHVSARYHSWFDAGVRMVATAGDATEAAAREYFRAALREADPFQQKRHWAGWFYGLGDGVERARAHYLQAREAMVGHDLALINAIDHGAQLAADDVGIPWLCYVQRPPPDPAQADPINRDIDTGVSDLLAEATGKQRFIRTFRRLSPVATLVACSPNLAPPHPVKSVVLTGAWLDPPGKEPLPEIIENHLAGGPTLLTTFGAMPDLSGRSEALVHAAAASDWRAIVQVIPPAPAPTDCPPGIVVFRDQLPFASLLPRVSGVVHHGSVGTTHEVARAGRPSLVVPHMGDQFYWAHTLPRLGLGPESIRFTAIDPTVLAERMSALRTTSFAQRAAHFGAALMREDGVGVAVRRIEAALKETR